MTTPQQPNRPRDRRADQRKTRGRRGHQDRQISVRAVRRDPPDLRKLSRAIVAIAIAQAEAEAQAQIDAADEVMPANTDDDQGASASCDGASDEQ